MPNLGLTYDASCLVITPYLGYTHSAVSRSIAIDSLSSDPHISDGAVCMRFMTDVKCLIIFMQLLQLARHYYWICPFSTLLLNIFLTVVQYANARNCGHLSFLELNFRTWCIYKRMLFISSCSTFFSCCFSCKFAVYEGNCTLYCISIFRNRSPCSDSLVY